VPSDPAVADRPVPSALKTSWIALRVHAASAAIARRFARDVVCGHTAHDAYTVTLLVSELVTNALRRADEVGTWAHYERPVKLGVLATDRWVRLSVTDPDPAPIDPAAPVENGFGLLIVDVSSVRRWPTFEADSKTVHVLITAPGVTLTDADLAAIGASA
jgi:hypothetical protein